MYFSDIFVFRFEYGVFQEVLMRWFENDRDLVMKSVSFPLLLRTLQEGSLERESKTDEQKKNNRSKQT